MIFKLSDTEADVINRAKTKGHDGSLSKYIKWYDRGCMPKEKAPKPEPVRKENPKLREMANKLAKKHGLQIHQLFVKNYMDKDISKYKIDFVCKCNEHGIPVKEIASFMYYSITSIHRLMYRGGEKVELKSEMILKQLKKGPVFNKDYHGNLSGIIFELRKQGYNIETINRGYKLQSPQ